MTYGYFMNQDTQTSTTQKDNSLRNEAALIFLFVATSISLLIAIKLSMGDFAAVVFVGTMAAASAYGYQFRSGNKRANAETEAVTVKLTEANVALSELQLAYSVVESELAAERVVTASFTENISVSDISDLQ